MCEVNNYGNQMQALRIDELRIGVYSQPDRKA